MIRLENAVKSFDDKPVLKNVNINVETGTIFGLLGPRGT